MNISISGQITHIFEAESFTAADGHLFTRRRFRIETAEQYPQSMLITVRNEMAVSFPHSVGDNVTAHLSFSAHPNRDQTSFFNDIRAWRVE